MKTITALLIMLSVATVSIAADIPSVTYNHYDGKWDYNEVKVNAGSFIDVQIIDTCPKFFNALSTGLEKEIKKQPEPTRVAGGGYVPPENLNKYIGDRQYGIECYIDPSTQNRIKLQVPHYDKYGGYNISLKYNDAEYTKLKAGKINDGKGINALRIVKGKSVDGLNEGLKNNSNKWNENIKGINKAIEAEYAKKPLKADASPAEIKASKDNIEAELQNKYENDSRQSVAALMKEFVEIKELHESQFMIAVKQSDWRIELAGAFTTSFLTDKKYGTQKNATDENIVIRQKDNEDAASLGLAAFVHVAYPGLLDKCKLFDYWAPLSFGLGINNNSTVSYFIGSSIRFSDKAYLTFGYNWGPTKTLPSGVTEGSVITDPNGLNNMGSKTGGGLFLAVSYSFLDSNESAFKKPFAAPDAK